MNKTIINRIKADISTKTVLSKFDRISFKKTIGIFDINISESIIINTKNETDPMLTISRKGNKKDKKEKLAWQTWNKFLNGTTKLERDAKIQKMGDNEKEKYLVENLDPWISILKFRDFDGVDRPKLKEFSVRLQNIIKQRTFEDFEDEFDSE